MKAEASVKWCYRNRQNCGTALAWNDMIRFGLIKLVDKDKLN